MRKLSLAVLCATLLLSAALPVQAVDMIQESAPGTTGSTGGTGTTPPEANLGQHGIDGGQGQTGGTGGEGSLLGIMTGNVDTVVVTSTGGQGGTGGTGGTGGVGGRGKDGGDGGKGGTGGTGGTGGAIDVTLWGAVSGDVTVTSQGGQGGNGGRPGDGGNGRVAGGAGGPGSPSGAPGTIDPNAAAAMLALFGDTGAEGAGGSVNVVLQSSVGGNVTVNGGSVRVELVGGSSVVGTISTGTANSTLAFSMSVNTQAEKDAQTAAFAPGANGDVTLNGTIYRWSGFSQLENLLTVLQQPGSPSGPIVITIREPSTAWADAPPQAKLAGCDNPAFRLSTKGDVLRVLVKLPDAKTFALLGEFRSTKFRTATAGWSIKLAKSKTQFDVLDPKGQRQATCVMPVGR